MTEFVEAKPAWFKVVAVLLVIWALLGCAACYMHVAYGPAMDPNATDWDRAYFAALPKWFAWDFAVAVIAGLIGSVALLMGKRAARPLYIVSLVAALIQFGYMFFATDVVAHKGAAATVPMPVVIIAVTLFQLWLAGMAIRKGWLR